MNSNGRSFDLEGWIQEHPELLHVVRSGSWAGGGRRWILSPCPWNPDEHNDTAAFVVQLKDGGIDAGCHHAGCADKDWHALRDLVEPDWREHRNGHHAETDEGDGNGVGNWAGTRLSYDEMLRQTQTKRKWLAAGFIPDMPIIGLASEPGDGKTWIGLSVGLSVAAGLPVFGQFPANSMTVLYLDAENPPDEMQRRVVALARGLTLPDSLPFAYRGGVHLDLSTSEGIIVLSQTIATETPDLIVLDSLIDFHTANELDGGDMTKVMLNIRRLHQEHGVRFIILHHFRKRTGLGANDSKSRFKGSVNIPAGMDVAFGMRATADGCIVINVAKERVRTLAGPIKVALRDTEGVIVEYIGVGRVTSDDEVLAFIREFLAGGDKERTQILTEAEKRNLSRRAVDDWLRREDGGIVTSRKDGRKKVYGLAA